MKKEKKVKLTEQVFYPNNNVVKINTRKRLLSSGHFSFGLEFGYLITGDHDPQESKLQKARVQELMKVPGIVEIGIEPYSIIVEKAPLFKWEEGILSRVHHFIRGARNLDNNRV
jgi:hypothetical protein